MIETNALREISDPRAGTLLLDALKQKKTRFTAAYALARLADNRAVEPLIGLLRSPDGEDRRIAADNLGSFKDERVTLPLSRALSDSDEVVRRFAASSLGELGDLRGVRSLIVALSDFDDGVRWNASNSLGKLKDAHAVNPLTVALKDSDENVRKAAADALGEIADPRAVPALIAAFEAGNRWHTAAALANIRNSQAADFLNARLRERQLDVVAAAHLFFIGKGDASFLPALVAALNRYGRAEMAQAYMFCGNPQLENAARQWVSTHDYGDMSPPDAPLRWGSAK